MGARILTGPVIFLCLSGAPLFATERVAQSENRSDVFLTHLIEAPSKESPLDYWQFSSWVRKRKEVYDRLFSFIDESLQDASFCSSCLESIGKIRLQEVEYLTGEAVQRLDAEGEEEIGPLLLMRLAGDQTVETHLERLSVKKMEGTLLQDSARVALLNLVFTYQKNDVLRLICVAQFRVKEATHSRLRTEPAQSLSNEEIGFPAFLKEQLFAAPPIYPWKFLVLLHSINSIYETIPPKEKNEMLSGMQKVIAHQHWDLFPQEWSEIVYFFELWLELNPDSAKSMSPEQLIRVLTLLKTPETQKNPGS